LDVDYVLSRSDDLWVYFNNCPSYHFCKSCLNASDYGGEWMLPTMVHHRGWICGWISGGSNLCPLTLILNDLLISATLFTSNECDCSTPDFDVSLHSISIYFFHRHDSAFIFVKMYYYVSCDRLLVYYPVSRSFC
jgi:hypothetical protein